MQKRRSVALFGRMAAGKTTIAAVLAETGYTKLSFATPLKNVGSLAYGQIGKGDSYQIEHGGQVITLTGREVLQQLGQSVKAFDRDFWLKAFLRDAERHGDSPIALDDGRFKFERDALRARGFLIVGINAPESVRHYRYEMLYGRKPRPEEENHASEIEVDEILYDADIILQGTDDPYQNVRRIMEKV